jgi:2-polyprenyl-3-methyl-5-hydroxy-6-metoxy-1,4-benzoquinol methylase
VTQSPPPQDASKARGYYTRDYFKSWNYAARPLGKFSMYWFARRYYAALVRRYAPPGGPLLEMGCGLGHLLGLLQDDYRCIGIDLIDYSIEQTKLNAPKAEAYQMDAGDLSRFDKGSFSAVIALHLVEHLPDPADTLRQVSELLRPGGIFLFATPHPEYSLRRFKDRDTDAIGMDKTHINVHPPQQWRAWCEAHGMHMAAHFGDGLWQVLTRTTFTPLSMGVNQVGIARKG